MDETINQGNSDVANSILYAANLRQPQPFVEYLTVRGMLRRVHARRNQAVLLAGFLRQKNHLARKAFRIVIDLAYCVSIRGDPVTTRQRGPDQLGNSGSLQALPGFVKALINALE